MIETGLFSIYNCDVPLHYAVDITPDYAGIAVFAHVPPGVPPGMAGVVPWATLLTHLETPPAFGKNAGFVDFRYGEAFVPDFPGKPNGAVYKGRSYIFAGGMNGLDEIVDYSLLDIAVGVDGHPQSWRNRFAQSAREKIDTSFRHRARQGISNALVIFMPIRGRFDQARIEVLCQSDPILLNGTVLTGRIDDALILKDGHWYKRFYFHAEIADKMTVPAGGRSEVPVALKWNGDGTPCAHALTLTLEADAGYLPKRRFTTDASGAGIFVVDALGLDPGDHITVKINTAHYSAIGKIVLEVV